MKILTEKRSSFKLGFVTFLAGVISLFLPALSGWNDIVFPQFAFIGLIFYLLWPVFFAVALGLSLWNTRALFFTNASSKIKVISICLSVGLIALFLSIRPGVAQRVSFFPVGGQTRILWAGGLETVKRDALVLLEQQSDQKDSVSSDVWPSSLKRLGAIRVRIENETQSTIIYLPQAHMFDPDQFGYLITQEKEASPEILNREDNNRLWKLTDGVYFFETW